MDHLHESRIELKGDIIKRFYCKLAEAFGKKVEHVMLDCTETKNRQ